MSAAEYGFPEPADAPASYLEVTENCFKNIMSRWDTGSCGGGLKWQIYPDNANAGGYHYKNAISNGAAFALAARLARFTGKSEYSDWAKTIYEWSRKVGLIGDKFEVFDGTNDQNNCATVSDKTEWSYNNAMYLHGSAFMYDVTKGDSAWKDRVSGLLEHADIFFQNPGRVANVMFERCEYSTKFCNLDQQSFKAYLSRWMAKTAVLAPFTSEKITKYLETSAVAAGKTCGDDGASCGTRWYTGSNDGVTGIGQQLNAMEITQALMTLKKKTLPGTGGSPAPKPSSAAPSSSKVAPTPTPTPVESKKPEESKPVESKKPEESKAPETKQPEATQPIESKKPEESKAPETKPAEAKPTFSLAPVPSKPAVGGEAPASTSCTESKDAATTPVATASKPIESKPVESKPVESKPIESKPATSVAATGVATPAPQPSGSSPAGNGGFQFTPSPPKSTCSCTGKKTVTVWVPPTSVPAPPASTSVVQSSSAPVAPPPASVPVAAPPASSAVKSSSAPVAPPASSAPVAPPASSAPVAPPASSAPVAPPASSVVKTSSAPVAAPPASTSAVAPPPSTPVAQPPYTPVAQPPPVVASPPSSKPIYPTPSRNGTALPTGTGTPGNSSLPTFEGAASGTMMAGSTLFAAAALSVLAALL